MKSKTNKAAAWLGKLGGAAGRGEAKRRSRRQHAKAGRLGALARWGKTR